MRSRFLIDLKAVVLSQCVASLSALLFTMYVARQLGVEQFGLFQSFMALYYCVTFFNLPLYLVSIDTTGREPAAQQQSVGLALLKTVAVFTLLEGIVITLGSASLAKMIQASSYLSCLVIPLMMIFKEPLTCAYGVVQGTGYHSRFASVKTIESVLLLVFGIGILTVFSSAESAVICYPAAAVCGLAVMFGGDRQMFLALRQAPLLPLAKLRLGVPLVLYLGVLTLLSAIPLLVARATFSIDSSGFVAALYNLRSAIFPFGLSIVLPLYTRLLANTNTKKNFRAVMLINLAMGGVFFIGLISFPSEIFQLLYGFSFSWKRGELVLYALYILFELLALPLLFVLAANRHLNFVSLLLPFLPWLWFLSVRQSADLNTLLLCQCLSGLLLLIITGYSTLAVDKTKELAFS